MTPVACRAVPVEIRAGLLIDFSGDCWTWLGKIDRKGYGTIRETIQSHVSKDRLAHRLIYQFVKGSLTADLELDHLCRNRACVNPSHLEEVTGQINAQRGATSKLSPADVQEIRSTPPRWGFQSELARKYGVHHKAIQKVLKGESWTNVPSDPGKSSRREVQANPPGDAFQGTASLHRRMKDAGEKFYEAGT